MTRCSKYYKVKTFNQYIQQGPTDLLKNRIAGLLTARGLEPNSYIESYLKLIERPMLEQWMGIHGLMENFFMRLRSAWHTFLNGPHNQEQGLVARLEGAKKSVDDLHELLKQHVNVDRATIQTILRGLEQSLQLFNKVQPSLQDVEEKIVNNYHGIDSQPHDNMGVQQELPDVLHEEYVRIMQEHDRLIKSPETDETIQALLANNDKLEHFFAKVSKQNQQLPPGDVQKKRIESWLQRIENDAAFREVQNLLEFAKRRHDGGTAVQRPDDYHQAVGEWMKVATRTNQESEQYNHMKSWYAQLPENHGIKQFVRSEMQEPEHQGKNEEDLFLHYAKYWKDRYPHHTLTR